MTPPDHGLPVIDDGGGTPRVLGCLPPPLGGPVAAGPPGRALPPDRWREVDLPAVFPEVGVDDQGQTLACVGFAVETAFTYAWLLAGRAFVDFSPAYVYALSNRGVDRGADIGTAVRALGLYGMAEAAVVPGGMIFRDRFPPEATASGLRHKPADCYPVASFDALCTALAMGQPAATGILVGRDFGRLDADGVAPLPGDGPPGGHALAVVGLHHHPRRGWLLLAQNSYGPQWGMAHPVTGKRGFCYLTREHFRVFYDTWVIGGVLGDPAHPTDALRPVV